MSAPGKPPLDPTALELPPFSLDVETLDLGADVKAVGLELLETESREPVRGKDAASIWAAVFPLLAANDFFVVDFFSHLDRVREFCNLHDIHYREAAERCLVLPQPGETQLEELFQRFEGETFGVRTGGPAQGGDAELEKELSRRGLDAYQPAYSRYTFSAVCEPEDGWVTLLSETLWPTEVIRRIRPALQKFDVYIARPH
ncbi:MAG TPA: hypothetical protein VNY81_01275 [Candidatus Saccharimonadales bacterium]|nr:hypothetical protein [Candidatus Saccharimonadales bacterium]